MSGPADRNVDSLTHLCVYFEIEGGRYPVCMQEAYIIILVALSVGALLSWLFASYGRCKHRAQHRALQKRADALRAAHARGGDRRNGTGIDTVGGDVREQQEEEDDDGVDPVLRSMLAEGDDAVHESPRLWFLDLVIDRVYSRRMTLITITLAFAIAAEIALGSSLYKWPFDQSIDYTAHKVRLESALYVVAPSASDPSPHVPPGDCRGCRLHPLPRGIVTGVTGHGIDKCRLQLFVRPHAGFSDVVITPDTGTYYESLWPNSPATDDSGGFNATSTYVPPSNPGLTPGDYPLMAKVACVALSADIATQVPELRAGTLRVLAGSGPALALPAQNTRPPLPAIKVTAVPRQVTIGSSFEVAAALSSARTGATLEDVTVETEGGAGAVTVSQQSPWRLQAVDVALHRLSSFTTPSLDAAMVSFLTNNGPLWDSMSDFMNNVMSQVLGSPFSSLSGLLSSATASQAAAALEAVLLPKLLSTFGNDLQTCLEHDAKEHGVSMATFATELAENATWAEQVTESCLLNNTTPESVSKAVEAIADALNGASGGAGATALTTISALLRLLAGASGHSMSAASFAEFVSALEAAAEAELGVGIDHPLPASLDPATTRSFVTTTGNVTLSPRPMTGPTGVYFVRLVYRGDSWEHNGTRVCGAYLPALGPSHNQTAKKGCFASAISRPFKATSPVASAKLENSLLGDAESLTRIDTPDEEQGELDQTCDGKTIAFGVRSKNFAQVAEDSRAVPCMSVLTSQYPLMGWNCPRANTDKDSAWPNPNPGSTNYDCVGLLDQTMCLQPNSGGLPFPYMNDPDDDGYYSNDGTVIARPVILAQGPNETSYTCANIEVRTTPASGILHSAGPMAPMISTEHSVADFLSDDFGITQCAVSPPRARLEALVNVSVPDSFRLFDGSDGTYHARLYCDGALVDRTFTFSVSNSYMPDLSQLSFVLGRGESSFWGTVLVTMIAVIPLLMANSVNPRSTPSWYTSGIGFILAAAFTTIAGIVIWAGATTIGGQMKAAFINFITLVSGVDIRKLVGGTGMIFSLQTNTINSLLMLTNFTIMSLLVVSFLYRLSLQVAVVLLIVYMAPLGFYAFAAGSLGGLHGLRLAVAIPSFVAMVAVMLKKRNLVVACMLTLLSASVCLSILWLTFLGSFLPVPEVFLAVILLPAVAGIVYSTDAHTTPFLLAHAAALLISVPMMVGFYIDDTNTSGGSASGFDCGNNLGDYYGSVDDDAYGYNPFGTDDDNSYIAKRGSPCRFQTSNEYGGTATALVVALCWAGMAKLYRESFGDVPLDVHMWRSRHVAGLIGAPLTGGRGDSGAVSTDESVDGRSGASLVPSDGGAATQAALASRRRQGRAAHRDSPAERSSSRSGAVSREASNFTLAGSAGPHDAETDDSGAGSRQASTSVHGAQGPPPSLADLKRNPVRYLFVLMLVVGVVLSLFVAVNPPIIFLIACGCVLLLCFAVPALRGWPEQRLWLAVYKREATAWTQARWLAVKVMVMRTWQKGVFYRLFYFLILPGWLFLLFANGDDGQGVTRGVVIGLVVLLGLQQMFGAMQRSKQKLDAEKAAFKFHPDERTMPNRFRRSCARCTGGRLTPKWWRHAGKLGAREGRSNVFGGGRRRGGAAGRDLARPSRGESLLTVTRQGVSSDSGRASTPQMPGQGGGRSRSWSSEDGEGSGPHVVRNQYVYRHDMFGVRMRQYYEHVFRLLNDHGDDYESDADEVDEFGRAKFSGTSPQQRQRGGVRSGAGPRGGVAPMYMEPLLGAGTESGEPETAMAAVAAGGSPKALPGRRLSSKSSRASYASRSSRTSRGFQRRGRERSVSTAVEETGKHAATCAQACLRRTGECMRSFARGACVELCGGRADPPPPNPHARFETDRDFFYPQRVLLAFTITMVTLALFVSGILVSVQWGQWWLSRGIRIEATALREFELFGTASDGLAGWRGMLLRVASLGLLEVRNLGLYPDVYIDITYYSISGAAVLSFFAVVAIWVAMLREYKRNIFRLRRGEYWFDRSQFNVTLASRFVGYQVIHFTAAFLCCFGTFVVVAILCVLTVYIPALQHFWLLQVTLPLLAWIVPWVFFYQLLYLIFSRVFTNRHTKTMFTLQFMRSWTYLDYFSVFVYLIAGLVVVLVRVAWLPAIALVSLWRLDTSILSRRWESSDPGYASYISMLLMDHMYQNPVVNVFVELMMRDIVKARNARLAAVARAGKAKANPQTGAGEAADTALKPGADDDAGDLRDVEAGTASASDGDAGLVDSAASRTASDTSASADADEKSSEATAATTHDADTSAASGGDGAAAAADVDADDADDALAASKIPGREGMVAMRMVSSGILLWVTPEQASVMRAAGEATWSRDVGVTTGTVPRLGPAPAPVTGAAVPSGRRGGSSADRSSNSAGGGGAAPKPTSKKYKQRARALRMRWWVYVTLARNPTIRQYRKVERKAARARVSAAVAAAVSAAARGDSVSAADDAYDFKRV